MIYELIVDEANYIYIIRNFINENCLLDEYPLEVFSYLIKGLDAAGYQKIEFNYCNINS